MIIIPLMIQKAGVYSTDEDLGPKLELDLETTLRFTPPIRISTLSLTLFSLKTDNCMFSPPFLTPKVRLGTPKKLSAASGRTIFKKSKIKLLRSFCALPARAERLHGGLRPKTAHFEAFCLTYLLVKTTPTIIFQA